MNPGWIAPAEFAAFAAANTNAHRLFSGADGWVERFCDDVLISYKTDAARASLLASLADWSGPQAWQPRRVFQKLLPRQNEERDPPVLVSGDATLPRTGEARENGVRYGLDFAAGYSPGLFLDQRMNRAYLRGAAPTRLLNTFAYTCSFSVVAALAGAETVSIDLSKKSLDRGRANFLLNGLEPQDGHRFLADDVLEVLPRLARRGKNSTPSCCESADLFQRQPRPPLAGWAASRRPRHRRPGSRGAIRAPAHFHELHDDPTRRSRTRRPLRAEVPPTRRGFPSRTTTVRFSARSRSKNNLGFAPRLSDATRRPSHGPCCGILQTSAFRGGLSQITSQGCKPCICLAIPRRPALPLGPVRVFFLIPHLPLMLCDDECGREFICSHHACPFSRRFRSPAPAGGQGAQGVGVCRGCDRRRRGGLADGAGS